MMFKVTSDTIPIIFIKLIRPKIWCKINIYKTVFADCICVKLKFIDIFIQLYRLLNNFAGIYKCDGVIQFAHAMNLTII